mmetsp:Transcript_13586/g.31129  ORF Transcript_13586/g.31129 Transcript_13586/m.31129 type:complete len:291 (+) Transcript_13586:1270-2142(+)
MCHHLLQLILPLSRVGLSAQTPCKEVHVPDAAEAWRDARGDCAILGDHHVGVAIFRRVLHDDRTSHLRRESRESRVILAEPFRCLGRLAAVPRPLRRLLATHDEHEGACRWHAQRVHCFAGKKFANGAAQHRASVSPSAERRCASTLELKLPPPARCVVFVSRGCLGERRVLEFSYALFKVRAVPRAWHKHFANGYGAPVAVSVPRPERAVLALRRAHDAQRVRRRPRRRSVRVLDDVEVSSKEFDKILRLRLLVSHAERVGHGRRVRDVAHFWQRRRPDGHVVPTSDLP